VNIYLLNCGGEFLVKKKNKVSVKKSEDRTGELVPWRSEIVREMDRMIEDLRKNFDQMLAPMRGGGFRPWFPRFGLPEVREPCADLVDRGEDYLVCAEIPGIPKEDLEVTVTPRGIEISGEASTDVEEKKEGFVRRERGYSRIHRSLTFPEEVLPDKVEATLKDGLLEITLPKKTPPKVAKHKVEIK
jgi:HSP20 family protein